MTRDYAESGESFLPGREVLGSGNDDRSTQTCGAKRLKLVQTPEWDLVGGGCIHVPQAFGIRQFLFLEVGQVRVISEPSLQ